MAVAGNGYRWLVAARAALGEDEFDRVCRRGRELNFDDAVDLALGRSAKAGVRVTV